MIRRSVHYVSLLLIYLAGILLTFGLSIWFLFIDYAGRDWIAFLIVMPLAWLFSYWPMVGSLMMVLKIRRIQNSLDEIAQRARANGGRLEESDRQDLTDLAVEMVSNETGLPRFLAKRMVNWFIARMSRAEASEASASQH